MELNTESTLNENTLNDLDNESSNDDYTNPNPQIDLSNPSNPLVLEFSNQLLTIKLSGWTEGNLLFMLDKVLGHSVIANATKINAELLPKQVNAEIEKFKVESKKDGKTNEQKTSSYFN